MKAKWLVVLLALGVGACIEEVDDAMDPRDGDLVSPLRVQRVPAPLPGAHCSVQVDGIGVLDMETDYLPHVITCENGGAGLEGLKAQAIAARSVAYYGIETAGSICDGQGCQVYSCGTEPSDLAYQAVMETSGLYLMYNSTLTYAFYVAGDSETAPPACVGVSGSTEGWVTYNEGRSGTDVIQTELGFVHDPADSGYGQNRGCMSQWGGRCLENNNGYDYLGILRFYYGEDIEVQQAVGECVTPVDPTDPGSSGGSGGMETTDGPGATSMDAATGSESGDEPDPSGNPESGQTMSETSATTDAATDATASGPGGALPSNYGDPDRGCNCSTPHSPPPIGFLLLLLAPFLRRRR